MASSSGDGSDEPILHPVWRELPVELMEICLKRVPFESLTGFRAVCKRFNSLITSPKFARECQRQLAWKPVPMIVRKDISLDSCSVDVFNTETNSWVTRPLPLPVLEARLYPLKLCAVSGGLLCLETRDFGKVVVCNPLTGAFRLLGIPKPLDDEVGFSPVVLRDFKSRPIAFLSHRAITGLVVDLQKGTFTLVLVTLHMYEGKRKTFVYDSADGSWRSGAPLPVVGCFIHIHWRSFEGNIRVLVKQNGGYKLLKYYVRDDSWSESLFLLTASQLQDPKIFYKKREVVTSHGESLVKEGDVLQACPENLETLCKGWFKDIGDVVTTAVGNVICITRCTRPGYPMQVVHFNSITHKSSFLPDCLTTKTRKWAGKWTRNEFEFELLEPSLTVDL